MGLWRAVIASLSASVCLLASLRQQPNGECMDLLALIHWTGGPPSTVTHSVSVVTASPPEYTTSVSVLCVKGTGSHKPEPVLRNGSKTEDVLGAAKPWWWMDGCPL